MGIRIHTFELTAYLDTKGKKNKDTYDVATGIRANERDNKNWKTLHLIITPCKILGGNKLSLWKPDEQSIAKLLKKLRNGISEYYNDDIELDDFELTGLHLTRDCNVNSEKKVVAYIQILKNIGKISGFNMKYEKPYETSHDLKSSSGIEFTGYGKYADCELDEAKGLLRIEVKLVKKKAINNYTNETELSAQLMDLYKKRKKIFNETFEKIVPPGKHCTMKQAEKLIKKKVSKKSQQLKMMNFLKLSKKMTLHEAKKELKDKNFFRIIEKFIEINLSPVTIRKRYGISELKSLYDYLE